MSLIEHKKARFDYEILEEFEAGLELLGHEVKALRQAQGKLEGAHVIIRGGEAYVTGMSIPPYQPKNTPKDYDPHQTRRLLVTKKEKQHLTGKERESGLTLVPLKAYIKGRLVKLELGLGQHKTKADTREVIKKRETDRDIRRALKK